MNEPIEKFKAIEKEIADQRGGLVLFGLFKREDSPGKWDVVISAPWVGKSRREALDYVIGVMRSQLSPEEMISLSRIVVLKPSEEFVKEVNSIVRVEHGRAELRDVVLNGMAMTHAYIITSRPEDRAAG
jgi:hypothetical protein